jgi:hypothetical protein
MASQGYKWGEEAGQAAGSNQLLQGFLCMLRFGSHLVVLVVKAFKQRETVQ